MHVCGYVSSFATVSLLLAADCRICLCLASVFTVVIIAKLLWTFSRIQSILSEVHRGRTSNNSWSSRAHCGHLLSFVVTVGSPLRSTSRSTPTVVFSRLWSVSLIVYFGLFLSFITSITDFRSRLLPLPIVHIVPFTHICRKRYRPSWSWSWLSVVSYSRPVRSYQHLFVAKR